MTFIPFPKPGIMNFDGNFKFIAQQISKAFETNKNIRVEFIENAELRPGHSVFIIETPGDAPNSYWPSIYIYSDGKIICSQIDDSIS